MNIFKMTQEELKEYLKLNIDTLEPDELLKELIECGLSEENESFYEIVTPYYLEDSSFSCEYDLTIHRTSRFLSFFNKRKKIDENELMGRAA